MNQFRSIDEPAAGHGHVIGRLPLYGRFHARARRAFVRPFLFFISAVAAASAIYFFGVAAPLYTSDAQIAVRGKQAMTTSPLMAALGGVQSGVPESTALTQYIESGGMLTKVEASEGLRAQYSAFRPDFLYHLPAHASQHRLMQFYTAMIDVTLDPVANIITLHVRAFDPQAAQKTAMAIMRNSQEFVSALSAQMMSESTNAAQRDYDDARRDSIRAHTATAAFQAKSRSLDIGAYGTATNGAIFTLQSNIAQLRAQIASLMTYSTARSPQVLAIQAQIRNLEQQQAELQQKLTGQQNGSAVVNQLGTFQNLTINQTYADQRLTAAQAALDQARSVAQQRQLFIVPIIAPTLPDEPTPRRLWGFLTVMVLATSFYVIARLTLASIRDHQV